MGVVVATGIHLEQSDSQSASDAEQNPLDVAAVYNKKTQLRKCSNRNNTSRVFLEVIIKTFHNSKQKFKRSRLKQQLSPVFLLRVLLKRSNTILKTRGQQNNVDVLESDIEPHCGS